MIHHAIPDNAIADWDSTVIVRYGQQEDTTIGYNPQKPGRPSHHPLACVIGGTRLSLHMEWRNGNTVSSSGWIEAMEKVWRSPVAQHRIRLNRGDIGFGQEAIMAWHEQTEGKRPSYLFKLKLDGWSRERREIIERTLKPLNAIPQGGSGSRAKKTLARMSPI